jgi:hypothetical protein
MRYMEIYFIPMLLNKNALSKRALLFVAWLEALTMKCLCGDAE